tara:strand:- start:1796 stop:1981 length:186 start_codon:yes stop_codon:yes gene_type:complete
MEIHVSVGEWMNSLQNRMKDATEGDCFHLPTSMHLHAFKLLSEEVFPDKHFEVTLKPTQIP